MTILGKTIGGKDPQSRIANDLSYGLTDWVVTQKEKDEAVAVLAEISADQDLFDNVLTGLPERVVTRLLDALEDTHAVSPTTALKLRSEISSRYFKVCDVAVECGPAQKVWATTTIREMLKHSPEMARRLAASGTRVVILPDHSAVKEAGELQGPFSKMQLRYSWAAYSPAKKTLVAGRAKDTLTQLIPNNLVHELAHAIHYEAMSKDDCAGLERLYADRKHRPCESGRFIIDVYSWEAEDSPTELFAAAAAMFFGTRKMTDGSSKDFLRSKDPEMFAFMERLFGTKARDFSQEPISP